MPPKELTDGEVDLLMEVRAMAEKFIDGWTHLERSARIRAVGELEIRINKLIESGASIERAMRVKLQKAAGRAICRDAFALAGHCPRTCKPDRRELCNLVFEMPANEGE